MDPTALGRMKIQFCQAESRPKMRDSMVSCPPKRRLASRPVIASGERARRLSIASRISSFQSNSSGVKVTSPNSAPAEVQAHFRCALRPGDLRWIFVEARLQACKTVRPPSRRNSSPRARWRIAGRIGSRACRRGPPPVPVRRGCRRSTTPAQGTHRWTLGHVQARECPAHHSDDFADEPVLAIRAPRRSTARIFARSPSVLKNPQAKFELVRTKRQNRIVEFPRICKGHHAAPAPGFLEWTSALAIPAPER